MDASLMAPCTVCAGTTDRHENDGKLDFYQQNYKDLRSKSKANNRVRKQKTRAAWHTRADLKREDPHLFWMIHRPCEICARLTRKSTMSRKARDRGNTIRKVVDRQIKFDLEGRYWWSPALTLKDLWKIYKRDWFDDQDDYWWHTNYEEEREDEFIERWFDVEYEFEPVKDPMPQWGTFTLELEREAAVRAWLGLAKDDFWAPFMDEECERIQDVKYRHYRENVPCWVGEKYYDLTPMLSRKISKGLVKAGYPDVISMGSFDSAAGRDKADLADGGPHCAYASSDAGSTTPDWVLSGYLSDCESEFSLVHYQSEQSTDSDWEAISDVGG